MRYVRFRVVEDQEFGGLGLKFAQTHKLCNGMFTIQNGLILAHDLVEHQQGHQKIGSIGDEMVALGGSCYTRGQWEDVSRRSIYSAADSLASDLTGQMATLYLEQNVPFRQKLVTSRDEDPSGFVDCVIETARDSWSKNYESYDLDHRPTQERVDTYLEACRTYMLHGAKLAHRRYGCGMLANNLFREIERVVGEDRISFMDYEGQEFLLGYDFKLNVTFREDYPEDYYW